MHAAILFLVLTLPGECETCQNSRTGGNYRPAPTAVNCPHYTPPVRWFRKPCAGCAGGTCLSCQAPYFGSAPYNYRVQFDYPWSQQPAYPLGCFPSDSAVDAEEIFLESSFRKPHTALKR